MAKSTERRGGRKIKYREEGKPVYLALSTPPPLVYLFFHAFHRFFTHHRAPKAGVYQSPSLPSFLPPLFARQKLQTLVGTFLRVVIVRARSSHTLRRRVLCGGHSMPRRKIYDIAIRATIYYKIAISTPDIHPLSVRSRHSLRSHPLLLPFLPLRHELRNFLGILLERCYFRLCDLFIFFQVWGFKIRKFKIFPYLGTDDE